MKSQEQQIFFLDHIWLPLHGINSITDYTTILTVSVLESIPSFLNQINSKINGMTEVFPVKKFNLHKTNHKIETHSQAFNILVQCLEMSEVPHTVWTEMHQRKTIRYLRLSQRNLTLEKYIEKMSEKRNNFETSDTSVVDSGSKREEPTEVIEQDELLKMVKHFKTHEYDFPLKNNQSEQSTGLYKVKIPLNNIVKGIYCLETRVEGTPAPYNIYLEINKETIVSQLGPIYNFEWDNPSVKETVRSHLINQTDTVSQYWLSSLNDNKNPLINEVVIPFQHVTVILGLQVFGTVINGRYIPIDELIENAHLHCKITEPCFSMATLEKMANSKVMIDLPNHRYVMINHKLAKLEQEQEHPSTPPTETPFDWIHIPDTVKDNHKNLTKLINTHRLTHPSPHLPFIDYHKVGHKTIALVNRQFKTRDILRIMVLAHPQVYEYKGHHLPIDNDQVICAHCQPLTGEASITYLTGDQVIHSYEISRTCDTINNICVNFPLNTGIPIGTKVELFYGDQRIYCQQDIQDKQEKCITLLPTMNIHYNLVGSFEGTTILKVSYPKTDQIAKHTIQCLCYYFGTPERRLLAQKYNQTQLVDLEKVLDFGHPDGHMFF